MLAIRLIALVLAAVLAAACSSETPGRPQSDDTDNLPTTAEQTREHRVPDGDVLPAERRTTWNPGLTYGGDGIPKRKKLCAELKPSGGDDTPRIQQALDDCPADQIVQLAAGTFEINGEGPSIRRSDVTLRGAGPGKPGTGDGGTRLVKADRESNETFAVLYLSGGGPDLRAEDYPEPSRGLAADAVNGKKAVALVSTAGLRVGEYVYIDHDTMNDPNVVWTESQRNDSSGGERRYFNGTDRSLTQTMKITKIDGDKVSFETPFHTTFQPAHDAQLTRFVDNEGKHTFIERVGVENLYLEGGMGGDGHGNVAIDRCGYCWVANIESKRNLGTAVGFYSTYRSELRDSYVHSTADPYPGGGGYLIGLHFGAADNLVENNIVVQGNKVMTTRASGGGNVIAYNYMDDAYGEDYKDIQEVGLNAGHYTTPHMELFEGNQSFNFDGDFGLGNSIDITVFRNDFTGQGADAGKLGLSDYGMRRVIGIQRYHYGYNFLGNVLGYDGMTLSGQAKFVYELTDEHHLYPDNPRPHVVPMWALGYNAENLDEPIDPKVADRTIRHGNFDYVTKKLDRDKKLDKTLPASLYLSEKPAFFGDHAGPWVTPEKDGSVATLPARERFNAMNAK